LVLLLLPLLAQPEWRREGVMGERGPLEEDCEEVEAIMGVLDETIFSQLSSSVTAPIWKFSTVSAKIVCCSRREESKTNSPPLSLGN
jgi:hypothetical protein